jgi:hypothetical protein
MCLTSPTELLVSTAEKNIICFKNGYVYRFKFHPSHYSSFKYIKGKSTKQVELKILSDRFNKFAVEEGYHSSTKANNEDDSYDHVFLIPKGTKYIKGFNNYSSENNYVSETLVWMGYKFNPITWLRVWLYKNKK